MAGYCISTWKTLLLAYRKIDVRYLESACENLRFTHELTDLELAEAVASFTQFPALVHDLTSGSAKIEYEIVYPDRPLSTLSSLGENGYWPSPDDTRPELIEFARPGAFRSILVLWPHSNLAAGTAVPTGGWGLGMRASPWSHGATYATVTNAASWAWQIPLAGEVWLHEWLHGVAAYFAGRGYILPAGDADGADRHGYFRSPQSGWTAYYRDLMTGNVPENGQLLGIPLSAWRADGAQHIIRG